MDNNLDLEYERLLGEGSYGKVFLVKQQDGQRFAVKEIDLCKCDDEGRAQAHHEATLLSRLKHDNILAYIESVMNDDCLYIVTEYCGGGDLEDYLQILLKSARTVPEPLASEWILQIGSALKYLHDMRILHRDMKTKNIFLKDDLTVKLGDLGIAKVLDLNQSKANTFIGTPSYMSPELFTGKPYNHKTDIWGLGCCAFEMLTLKRAFEGKTLWTIIKEIKNGKEIDLPDQYSLELRVLIQDMMCQDPEDRPSANDIVENDYLVYHRGTAKKLISELPLPSKKEEKKKIGSRTSANLSGSFDRMIRQKNKHEEDRLRQSIASICEKINTLRSTMQGAEDMNTFVYHGDDDSDGELEASNTILDSETLKQYTQQLDTFVYKGDSDNDSDYYTEGSLGRKEQDKEDIDNTSNRTLITQYSNTLEELDSDNSEEADEVSETIKVKPETETIKIKPDIPTNGAPDLNDSDPDHSPRLDETLTSRYMKFNRLKDTMSINAGKKFKRSQSEFYESAIKKELNLNNSSEASSKKKTGKYLSNSFSGAHTLKAASSVDTQSSDSRLLSTVSSDRSLNTTRMKTCDRLEQSFLNKTLPNRGHKANRKVSTEKEDMPSGEIDVADVMSHLKEKLTLYTEDNGLQNDVKTQPTDVADEQEKLTLYTEDNGLPNDVKTQSPDVSDEQDSQRRKGKKKHAFIKKEAAKKKSSESDQGKVSPGSEEKNVTLYTHAQEVTFSKGERSSPQENGGLQNNLHFQNDCENSTEDILFVQRKLAEGIGVENLEKVLRVMSLIQSEKELKTHLEYMLGPPTFNEYKQYLMALNRLEIKDVSLNGT